MAPLTAEQLRAHEEGLGSSESGAALGVSPYQSPLDLYRIKTGEVERPDLSDRECVEIGTDIEAFIAGKYSERTGNKIRRRPGTFRHKQHPFMVAHPDRTIDGQQTILEVKNASAYTMSSWGPTGSDQVPDHYLVQVHHQMIVMDYPRAVLAALIGGNQLRWYEFERDPEMDKLITDGLCTFWYDHVEKRIPPEPSTIDDLNSLRDAGTSVVAEPAVAAAAVNLKGIRQQIKELEAEKAEFERILKDHMREHSTLLGADGSTLATWKRSKEGRRFDEKAFAKAHPDLHQEFVTPKPGARPLLIKIK